MSIALAATGIEPHVAELLNGLLSNPKRISSKFFYDDEGSRLFSRIMECGDYYPTRCEEEILREQNGAILDSLQKRGLEEAGRARTVNIVELGAGDGRKTLHLLREATRRFERVSYRPIDISESALEEARARATAEVPGLEVAPLQLDLETEMDRLPIDEEACNLVLYLGSSIGNFTPTEQREFFTRLRRRLRPGDYVLTGFDLKKDHRILIRAYDDSEGITREFNLNLLRRLGRELQASFDESAFVHHASYNPLTGAMESWLVSQKEQRIEVGAPGAQGTLIRLDAFEGIHVETSWKFSLGEIRVLALTTGYSPCATFHDRRGWFTNELWRSRGRGGPQPLSSVL